MYIFPGPVSRGIVGSGGIAGKSLTCLPLPKVANLRVTLDRVSLKAARPAEVNAVLAIPVVIPPANAPPIVRAAGATN